MNKEDIEIRKALNRKYPTPQFQQKDWENMVIKRISKKSPPKRHIGWWIAAAAIICLTLLTFTLCPNSDRRTLSNHQINTTNNSRPEKKKQVATNSIKQMNEDRPISNPQQKRHHQTHVKVLSNTPMPEAEIDLAITKNKEDFNRQLTSFYAEIQSDIEKYNRGDDISSQVSSIHSEINSEMDKLNREVTAQNAEIARMIIQMQNERDSETTKNNSEQ